MQSIYLTTMEQSAFRAVACRLIDGGGWVLFIERVEPALSMYLWINFQHLHQQGKVPPCYPPDLESPANNFRLSTRVTRLPWTGRGNKVRHINGPVRPSTMESMGFEPSARDDSRKGEMKYGSYLGLGYRQRSKGYRREWGIHVIAERVPAVVGIFNLQVETGLPGVGV
jgi:hypothetical protein